MSNHTRWLALVLIAANGTTVSAQTPTLAAAPVYPPYPPYSYARPVSSQPALAPHVVRPNSAPMPRVMYVPASPTDWLGLPVATSAPTVPTPIGRPTTPPAASVEPIQVSRVSRQSLSTALAGDSRADARAEAELVSLRQDLEWELAASANCGVNHACSSPSVSCSGHHKAMGGDCTNWLPKGHCTLQLLGGAYADISSAHYNWGQGTVRFGRVCDWECLDCLPGAFEFLAEATAAANYASDFGNHFYGGGLLMRYNFVKLGSRL
ncbi:MAG: hypothetical protein NZO58_03930, partial [Gemmataceae bacterium]|nr:hypothetical protein [Gemmataceae bacterium]